MNITDELVRVHLHMPFNIYVTDNFMHVDYDFLNNNYNKLIIIVMAGGGSFQLIL